MGAGSAGGTGARCARQPLSRPGLLRGRRRGRGAEGLSAGWGGRLRSCARTRRQPAVGSPGKGAPGHCPPARALGASFPSGDVTAPRGAPAPFPRPRRALGGSDLRAGLPGRPREAGGARLASAVPRTLMAWVRVRRLRRALQPSGRRLSDQLPPARGETGERLRPGLSPRLGEPRHGQCELCPSLRLLPERALPLQPARPPPSALPRIASREWESRGSGVAGRMGRTARRAPLPPPPAPPPAGEQRGGGARPVQQGKIPRESGVREPPGQLFLIHFCQGPAFASLPSQGERFARCE